MIGARVQDLDTPVLLVDLDRMESNIARMAAGAREMGVNWRPHTKGVKVPAIAHKEIAAGAIGITCAKLGEAEVMAAAGIREILIANQIVGPQKIARLMGLCRHADVIVAADSLENVQALDAAARAKGVRPRVIVEVDAGMARSGVEPGEPTVELSRRIHELPGLRYSGLMAWEGHVRKYLDIEERKINIEKSIGQLTWSARLCREAGLPVEIVSCGGTGSWQFTARVPGVTEVQTGGIIFNDMRYSKLGVDWPFALTILSTVVSRPTPTRIVTDAGRKTMSNDAAVPEPIGLKGVKAIGFSAEHTKIELEEPNTELKVGDTLEWIVGYGDTTVCMHDEMIGVRDGIVEVIWPILGRGKLQ